MKLTFLGTGSATGFPSPFCSCETCQEIRAEGGSASRALASLLINEDLIIDFGPDLTLSTGRLGISLTGARYILQTHPHSDHFGGMTFYALETADIAGHGIEPLQLFCSRATVDRLDTMKLANDPYKRTFHNPEMQELTPFRITTIRDCERFDVGSYRVQSVPAHHEPGIDAMLFAVQDTGTGAMIFYGTDTGGVTSETWQFLASEGWRFDVLILDQSYGKDRRSIYHHGEESFLADIEDARTAGVLKESTRILATHISHFSYPSYTALKASARDNNYELAFDGLTIELGSD